MMNAPIAAAILGRKDTDSTPEDEHKKMLMSPVKMAVGDMFRHAGVDVSAGDVHKATEAFHEAVRTIMAQADAEEDKEDDQTPGSAY